MTAPFKLKRHTPPRWRGNGFGTEPGTYLVIYQGENVGSVFYCSSGLWRCDFHEGYSGALHANSLAKLRKLIGENVAERVERGKRIKASLMRSLIAGRE